jgi:N-acetylmuramoyl-L-alanine amidase
MLFPGDVRHTIETRFLSNPFEDKLLSTYANQEKKAIGLFLDILSYFDVIKFIKSQIE